LAAVFEWPLSVTGLPPAVPDLGKTFPIQNEAKSGFAYWYANGHHFRHSPGGDLLVKARGLKSSNREPK
jgi:hypothetical protein